MARSCNLSPLAQREVVDELMRRDLLAFVRRAFETVVPRESLRLNWHIHAMAHVLEQVRKGKIKRLIITVPPRHLKSITTSVAFPAFLLGHDPSTKIICVSYSADPAAHILIEDKGSGTSLIQELRREQVSTISVIPENDKVTRLYATQPRFESGCVHFPENASWLDELMGELLGFPEARHDDQVDSISQALAWIEKRKESRIAIVGLS